MNAPPETIQKLRSYPLFSSLSPEEYSALAGAWEEKSFPEGRDLFREGEEGNYFYLLISGAVSLWRRHGREMAQVAFLGAGDAFGEEVLSGAALRKVTAHVESDATVLRASADFLAEYLLSRADLRREMQAVVRGHHLAWSANFPWLAPDETVFIATRKAGVMLAPALALPVIIGLVSLIGIPAVGYFNLPGWAAGIPILGLLIALGLGIWAGMDWSNDYYLVTNRRAVAIRRIPLIYDERQETPLEMIQSVSVSSTVDQRMFGFGDVVVRTFTRPIVFRSVSSPNTVAHIVEAVWKWNRSRETETDRAEIIRVLAQRLGKAELDEPTNATPVSAEIGEDSSSIAENESAAFGRVQTRFESGGTVTYRKHVFFLLRNGFLPILLSFWGLIVSFLGMTGIFPIDKLLGIGIGLGLTLLGVLWSIYEYLDWANDLYQVTSDQILALHRRPFGDEERRAAALENILSLEYDRPSPLARLLDFGTVKATVGQVNFTFEEVSDPVHVQEDIFRRMEAKRKRREAQKRRARQEEIADWIETYHDLTRDSGDGG